MPLEFLCFCLYPHLQTQRDIPLWNCHFQDPRKYNRAQFILGKHGKPRITPKKDFIYKGIATCGECGCSITAEYKYKAKYDKTYIYYHCTHKRGNCRQGSIEEKEPPESFQQQELRIITVSTSEELKALEAKKKRLEARYGKDYNDLVD